MKKKSLVILMVLISFTAYSQNKWINGFVVDLNGDTISGLIQFANSKTCSKYCKFRLNGSRKVKRYMPSEIREYVYDGQKVFVSREIKINSGSKTVFLEFLVKGKINLYHYREIEDYYFAEKEGVLIELKNTEEVQNIQDDNRILKREKKEYINILNYIFSDANMLPELLESDYSTESFMRLAESYHNKVCTSEKCIVYEKVLLKPKVVFGLNIGTHVNQYQFNDYLKTNYSSSFSIGTRCEAQNLIEWIENISFVGDLNLHYYPSTTLLCQNNNSYLVYYKGTSSTLSNFENENNSKSSLDVKLNTLYLSIPIVVNYNFPVNNGDVYVGIGINSMFMLSQANLKLSPGISYSLQDAYSTRDYTYLARIGYKWLLFSKRYSYVELQLERSFSKKLGIYGDESDNGVKNVFQYRHNVNTEFSFRLGYEF